jgi:lipopolysaccharide export system protein LptC
MEEVTAIIMNKDGHPSLRVESPKLEHYAENDRTNIIKPHITIYRDSPEPWTIHADYAKTTHGTEQIYFWGHVVIYHENDIKNPTTSIKTDTLTVFPEEQIAQTGDQIVITQPDTFIEAVGMLANLNEGTVKLLSQTRGEYVPHS